MWDEGLVHRSIISQTYDPTKFDITGHYFVLQWKSHEHSLKLKFKNQTRYYFYLIKATLPISNYIYSNPSNTHPKC